MDIAGYLASIFIGISLGLLGGGGSILTVPVLVYLFKTDATAAGTYSLFIVGVTSIVGVVSYFKKGLIDVKTAFAFGIPSVIAVLVMRTFILPAIPLIIITIGSFTLTRDNLLLLMFALLMLLAAFSMISKGRQELTINKIPKASYAITVVKGFGVGLITGLVGAGGGFLIIPALIKFLRLSMKTAIGTSLFIIAINSLTGFAISASHENLQWKMLLTITAMAIAGIFIGSFVAARMNGNKLKTAFGWFVLAMGIFIILKETIF